MLAAFATTDGKFINQHFGHTPGFLVVEIDDGSLEWKTVGVRENPPACSMGNHDEASIQQSIDIISDCSVLFAVQIGPYVKNALDRRGVRPLEVTGFISDVMGEYINYLKRQRQKKEKQNTEN